MLVKLFLFIYLFIYYNLHNHTRYYGDGTSQVYPGDRRLSCSLESFVVTLSQNITRSCSLCRSSPLLSKLYGTLWPA